MHFPLRPFAFVRSAIMFLMARTEIAAGSEWHATRYARVHFKSTGEGYSFMYYETRPQKAKCPHLVSTQHPWNLPCTTYGFTP